MTRLFLIRHGRPEGAWGSEGGDPGLSDTGLRQAEAAAAALVQNGSLKLISSPMRRCRETAAPYARLSGVEPLIEPRVGEIVAPPETADRATWLQERFPFRTPGASRSWATLEPALHAWRDAMLLFLRGVREDTAIYTHFIAINVITGAARGSQETIVCRPDHASITEMGISGDGMLHLLRAAAEMQIDDVR